MKTIWSVVAAILVVIGAGVGIEAGVRGSVATAPTANAQPGVVAQPGQLSPAQVRAQLAAALAEWSGFPVDASPRPVVLVGPSILVPGFTSGDAKIAFLSGAVQAPATFPTGPATELGYPVTGAAAAFHQLLARTAALPDAHPTPLRVVRVQFASAHFDADHETSSLPAWLFWLDQSRGPIAVLAVAQSAIYKPPGSTNLAAPHIGRALIESDDRTVGLVFAGGPAGTGPCSIGYTVSVATSKTAVAVDVVAHPHQSTAMVLCADVGVSRVVTVKLPAPIGNRVLVDAASGTAVNVWVAGKLYLLGS